MAEQSVGGEVQGGAAGRAEGDWLGDWGSCLKHGTGGNGWWAEFRCINALGWNGF